MRRLSGLTVTEDWVKETPGATPALYPHKAVLLSCMVGDTVNDMEW